MTQLDSVCFFFQQEVLSAPFSRQTVRRAHGLRSAAHSTLFIQPPTALSPQVSPSHMQQCTIYYSTKYGIVSFCTIY